MANQPKLKSCFVVGPIGPGGSDTRVAADWLLKGIIKPVMDDFDFLVRRADEIPEPGMIDSQVITSVLDADLVIADLSEHNANAFYELAIRHMVQKPIIHMIEKGTDIPFDVRSFRAIQFSVRAHDDLESAKAELRMQVAQCIKPDHTVDNPITRARGKLELVQSATPRDQVLLEELYSLSARLDRVERGNRDLLAQSLYADKATLPTLAKVLDREKTQRVAILLKSEFRSDIYIEKIKEIMRTYRFSNFLSDTSESTEGLVFILDLPKALVEDKQRRSFINEVVSISGVEVREYT